MSYVLNLISKLKSLYSAKKIYCVTMLFETNTPQPKPDTMAPVTRPLRIINLLFVWVVHVADMHW